MKSNKIGKSEIKCYIKKWGCSDRVMNKVGCF